jgi:hypothetical protein
MTLLLPNGDPISGMQDGSEFIVMVASAKSWNGAGYAGRYGKVALCEVAKGVRPKMISRRARGMVSSGSCGTTSTSPDPGAATRSCWRASPKDAPS